jgi:hypothetical protein
MPAADALVDPASRHPKPRYLLSNALWASKDPVPWRTYADAYPRVAKAVTSGRVAKGKGEWFDTEERLCSLRDRLLEREPKFLTREDMLLVTDWKMTRNAWRMNHAMTADKANTEKGVKDASLKAFALWRDRDWKAAFSALDKPLKGVGPATCSVVFSLVDDNLPFYGEEAATAASADKDVAYTKGSYVSFQKAMVEKTKEVNALLVAAGKESLTPVEVEKALFSVSHIDFATANGLLQDEPETVARSGSKNSARRKADALVEQESKEKVMDSRKRSKKSST